MKNGRERFGAVVYLSLLPGAKLTEDDGMPGIFIPFAPNAALSIIKNRVCLTMTFMDTSIDNNVHPIVATAARGKSLIGFFPKGKKAERFPIGVYRRRVEPDEDLVFKVVNHSGITPSKEDVITL